MNSLVIAPQWIGDAVMTEPLLGHLSERGEQITVFAVPWVAPVYRAMNHITGLQATVDVPFQHGGLQWQARRGFAARIQAGEWGKFNNAYVLPNSLKSALLPWLAGIPTRIGYKGEQRYGLLNQRLPNPPRDARGAMVEHYLRLAGDDAANNWGRVQGAACGDSSPDPNWLAGIRPQLFAALSDALQNFGLAAQTYTVIAPGAEYGPAKRWPAEHFAELITKLGSPVVLLGSAKESALCEAIRDVALQGFWASPMQTVHNLAGKTSLADAIQLIANAKSMVSNDSGLMHIAAAFGIQQVAIFGSSDPRHTPPLNTSAKVLWLKEMQGEFKGLACSPCFQRECPKTGNDYMRCLNAITPSLVVGALQDAALR